MNSLLTKAHYMPTAQNDKNTTIRIGTAKFLISCNQ